MKATATNQSISWFFQRYKEGALEISPDFQRNPVWLQPQKDYLIETILLELPIPEIYIVNRLKSDGTSTYVIVDGQQRLRTILEFSTGELLLKQAPSGFTNVFSFSDLLEEQKLKFWRYPIVVRDLEDSSDTDIRDLFERLNKHAVILNEQELRNARFKGEFIKTVEKLGELSFWTTTGIFSANDIRRMLDLEFISILLTTLIGGIYNRKERIDEFYANYEEEFEEASYYIDKFQNILETIEAILPDIKKTRWRNKADFYTLFLSIEALSINFNEAEKIRKLSEALSIFETVIDEAKNDPESVEMLFKDYAEAATYATNDKEKRFRRFKILSEFLKMELTE